MPTWTPPTFSEGRPTVLPNSSPQQYRLWRYYRPTDLQVNTFVLSDGTVVTDLPVSISTGSGMSSTAIPYPWNPAGSAIDPKNPATGGAGPFAQPPPYAVDADNVTGVVTDYVSNPWIVTFLSGYTVCAISTALANILTTAGFGAYIT